MKNKSNSKFSFIYLTVLVLSLFAVVIMLCILQEKIRENLRLFEKNPDKQKFYSMRNNKPNCNQIDPNLFEEMCNKKLVQNERYMRLVKLEKDGKEYEAQNFNAIRLKNFKVLFLTSNPYPNDKLVKATMPIKIVTSSSVNADDLDI